MCLPPPCPAYHWKPAVSWNRMLLSESHHFKPSQSTQAFWFTSQLMWRCLWHIGCMDCMDINIYLPSFHHLDHIMLNVYAIGYQLMTLYNLIAQLLYNANSVPLATLSKPCYSVLAPRVLALVFRSPCPGLEESLILCELWPCPVKLYCY